MKQANITVALRVIHNPEVITMNFRPPMGGFGQPAMGGMMGPGASSCMSVSAIAAENDLDPVSAAGMGQPMMMGGPRPGYNSPMPLGEARAGQDFSVDHPLHTVLTSHHQHPSLRVRRPPAGPIAKSTTLYVGKIAPTIPEDVIRSLLEACGTVKSWKPVLNEDGSPKGFGFCEYQSPDAVTRALRLLNNLKVDGQELLLKCTSATERYIQQHQVRPWYLKAGSSLCSRQQKVSAPGTWPMFCSLLGLQMLKCSLGSEAQATTCCCPCQPCWGVAHVATRADRSAHTRSLGCTAPCSAASIVQVKVYLHEGACLGGLQLARLCLSAGPSGRPAPWRRPAGSHPPAQPAAQCTRWNLVAAGG